MTKKVSELDPITSDELSATDLLLISDIGSALSKKLTVAQLDSRFTERLFGSYAAPRAIVAGTGITSGASHMSTTAYRQTIFVAGSGGVDISANPQIQAHTIVGAIMTIIGTSNANYVDLQDGTGLKLNGPARLGEGDMIQLMWIGSSLYLEIGRNF